MKKKINGRHGSTDPPKTLDPFPEVAVMYNQDPEPVNVQSVLLK